MAFRTNKMPVLQEKSASGAVASFNTALAMPLVECKTEFMCTQASGTPSPSNPLAITGVDDINITANGNSVVIDLDGTRYGGYVDVVGKKLVITHGIKIYNGSEPWSNYSSYNGFSTAISDMKSVLASLDGMCNRFELITNVNLMGVRLGANNNVVYFTQITNNISGVSDTTTWKTWLSNNNVQLTYPLVTPIEISLSDIPTLSTIIGNNSFASDSGSIDLTYKDLDIAKRGNFREVFKLPS